MLHGESMQMLLGYLDRATEYLSQCLKNMEFVEEIREKYPKEFDFINWAQELLLELFYALKDLDSQLMPRNLDIALELEEKRNFEIGLK